MLRDQSLLLGFELSREVGAGAGSLDMKATAPLKTGELVNIAIEAKNAHSGDIEDGIRFQLPEYMKSTSSTFGIYLVLWYKCEEFEEPKTSSTDLTWGLTKNRPYQTIIVELFDLSLPIPPSKLGRHSK